MCLGDLCKNEAINLVSNERNCLFSTWFMQILASASCFRVVGYLIALFPLRDPGSGGFGNCGISLMIDMSDSRREAMYRAAFVVWGGSLGPPLTHIC